MAAIDLFLDPARITSNISSGLVTYTSVASATYIPLPLSSLTYKLSFLANLVKIWKLTVQKVNDLFHVNLKKTALNIEFDGRVGLVDALKQVAKHSWE